VAAPALTSSTGDSSEIGAAALGGARSSGGDNLGLDTSGPTDIRPGGNPGRPALQGRHVRAVAPETWERLWAVVDGREIWRTEGDGWERVASLADLAGGEDLEALCLADTRANPLGGILVGTSRARLVRVTEQREIEFVEAFDRAPGRDRWYTPWGGPPDIRTFRRTASRFMSTFTSAASFARVTKGRPGRQLSTSTPTSTRWRRVVGGFTPQARTAFPSARMAAIVGGFAPRGYTRRTAGLSPFAVIGCC